ncbi:MAG: hypothetical protein MSA02_01260 [Bacteroidales bacterium]|nr:hypothetical protein [Bacteroidales bacterium]
MDNYIDIKKLNFDELVGVVNLYPWFGGARKELCRRMSAMGGGDCLAQLADAAMYVGDRSKLYRMARNTDDNDWADADVADLVKSLLNENAVVSEGAVEADVPVIRDRRVHVVGGDFFTQEDYDRVKKADDNVFSRYAAKAHRDNLETSIKDDDFDLYTETLARIYAEQGYYEHAKRIYSKLILAYPEKNAYFATLIEKLEKINN